MLKTLLGRHVSNFSDRSLLETALAPKPNLYGITVPQPYANTILLKALSNRPTSAAIKFLTAEDKPENLQQPGGKTPKTQLKIVRTHQQSACMKGIVLQVNWSVQQNQGRKHQNTGKILRTHQHSACMKVVVVQVNWSVLWRTWLERDIRELIVLPLIVLIILVPIGLFTGCAPLCYTHNSKFVSCRR